MIGGDAHGARYLDPEYCIRARLGDRPRPTWPTGLLLFRDFPASKRVLGLLEGARPADCRAFYNLAHEGQPPVMFEAEVAGQRIIIGVSCVWGGPQTAILVEELACLGVRHILGLGACGSLVPELCQGSVVLCGRALPTDGISRAYGVTQPLQASASLLEAALKASDNLGLEAHTATGAGVDALYRETEALISGLRAQGAQIVSLETSAFYAACAACSVEALWVGCVSDCLVAGEWRHWYIDLQTATEQTGLICRTVLEGLAGK